MGFLSDIADFGKNVLTGGAGKAAEGYTQGIAAQERMFNLGREDLAPYRDFGQNYLTQIRDLIANRKRTPGMEPTRRQVSPGAFPTRRQIRPEDVTSLPGYKFRLGQGRESLENSAIARGGLMSGNAMRAIMEHGQDYATDEYGRAYDRATGEYESDLRRAAYEDERNYGRAIGEYESDYDKYERGIGREEAMFQNDYGNLMNLVNLGYGAAGGSAGLAMQHGNSLADLYAGRGQAKAAGYRFPMELGATAIGTAAGMGAFGKPGG